MINERLRANVLGFCADKETIKDEVGIEVERIVRHFAALSQMAEANLFEVSKTCTWSRNGVRLTFQLTVEALRDGATTAHRVNDDTRCYCSCEHCLNCDHMPRE